MERCYYVSIGISGVRYWYRVSVTQMYSVGSAPFPLLASRISGLEIRSRNSVNFQPMKMGCIIYSYQGELVELRFGRTPRICFTEIDSGFPPRENISVGAIRLSRTRFICSTPNFTRYCLVFYTCKPSTFFASAVQSLVEMATNRSLQVPSTSTASLEVPKLGTITGILYNGGECTQYLGITYANIPGRFRRSIPAQEPWPMRTCDGTKLG